MITIINGIELGYDDVGNATGIPLVFVHAFPLNRTMWAPQVSALVDRCRCVSFDVRGLGDSKGAPPYTVDQYADDLAALLDQLHLDKIVLVGCSMGGYVSLAFWRRHRQLVRALVLADTRADADSEEARAKREEQIEVARTGGPTAVANQLIQGVVGKTTRERQPDTYDAVHRMMAQAPVEGIIGAIEAMKTRPDSTPLLATIDVPTLVVVGDEDALTPAKEARAMQERIPGSRLEVIAQAGHLACLERPAAFNHVLTEFLGALTYS